MANKVGTMIENEGIVHHWIVFTEIIKCQSTHCASDWTFHFWFKLKCVFTFRFCVALWDIAFHTMCESAAPPPECKLWVSVHHRVYGRRKGHFVTLRLNVSGYSRNPCSLNRERDTALLSLTQRERLRVTESWTHIESRQFIGWWRDAVSDAMTSSGHTGERAIHSSDFSAEKNPVGSLRSLAANAVSRSLFREQGLRE